MESRPVIIFPVIIFSFSLRTCWGSSGANRNNDLLLARGAPLSLRRVPDVDNTPRASTVPTSTTLQHVIAALSVRSSTIHSINTTLTV
jgi:hypothetical protein